ncbi:MAG: glycosyltransferase family 4 protein [Ignavibacteriaceae bacterium]|jgi:glycosyltransferase involved in cell wall biosynthesis|nr:glycosyltransferase family 4 protein [Ignavibacteriaceae bacterium]
MINVMLMIDAAGLGGGQKHVLWLAQKLEKERFKVTVACEGNGWLVHELHKSNIRHYAINISNRLNIKELFKIRGIIKREKPMILHTHGGTAGFYGRLAAIFLSNVKKVHTYHGIHYLNHEMNLSKRIFKWIDKLFLGLTDRVICVAISDLNEGIKAGVVNKGGAEVIYNGIEVDSYKDGIKKEQKGEEVIIGSIGRLHIQKGYKYLIDAAAILANRLPNIKFHIIGEGEERNELAARIHERGLDGIFLLKGSRENVNEELAMMDIFVLPSLWEGLPIVLLEAMAAKKPIIATRVNGTVEIIQNEKNGLLVAPENTEELADGIERLIKNTKLRDSVAEEALKNVTKEFSIKKCVSQTENVYNRIWGKIKC